MDLKMQDLNNIMTPGTKRRVSIGGNDAPLVPPKNLSDSLNSVGAAAKPAPPKPPSQASEDAEVVPIVPKKDTFYDFLMKEMMWLSADFTAERQRHRMSMRKLSSGVKVRRGGGGIAHHLLHLHNTPRTHHSNSSFLSLPQLFHQNKSLRARRKAETEQARVRALARRLSRSVQTYWSKIERVVGYKQKKEAEENRRR